MKKLFYAAAIAFTVFSLTALAGCSSSGGSSQAAADSAEDEYVLKIAYNNSLCEAPIQMGVEKGFFEEEGIKFEMVKVDAAHMPEAVGSGQIDVGFGLLGKYLQPIDNGLDIKVTAGIHTGCTKVLVPEDSDIYTVADLKGKKVGTTGLGAAAPTIITRRSLYHAGLNPSDENGDVEFIVYPGADLAQALANGAVDAIANGDPQASIAQRDYNLRAIIDTATDEEYKDEYCCISFVTGKLAKEHPELAEKFTRAIMKSSFWVANNIEETAQIQIDNEWVAGDVDFNAAVLKNYNYKPSVEGGLEALRISVPDLKAIGLISDNKTEEEFINDAFYRIDSINEEEIFNSVSDNAAADSDAVNTSFSGESSDIINTTFETKSTITEDCCETTSECCREADGKNIQEIPDCCA